MTEYTAQQGDCLESIAVTFGFDWKTVWHHVDNRELRQLRKDPNVLLPGDLIMIPDPAPRWESRATEQRHRFVRKGVPSKLVLVLRDFDRPRANEQYILEVDGTSVSGTTDSQGRIEIRIPPDAKAGRLLVGTDPPEEYALALGHIDPISTPAGVEARLHNLGYGSLAQFQKKNGLEVTGQEDAATLSKLQSEYGC